MKLNFQASVGIIALIIVASSAFGAGLVLESPVQQVGLLELYTSEGCSSCPPAERWFSTLKSDAGLWTHFVPVAFHVSYWDNASWRDRFSSKQFNDRQQAYAAAWKADNVYTPEVVLLGKERKTWSAPSVSNVSAGKLKVVLDDRRGLAISFAPTVAGGKYVMHAVLLGFDLVTSVRGGENDGLQLRHDFVALSYQSANLSQTNTASLTLPPVIAGEKALAVWLTPVGSTEPVQAVGGWLKSF